MFTARRALAMAAWAAMAAGAAPETAHGQTLLAPRVHLGFDDPESWAMKYFTSVTELTGFGPPPAGARAGRVELGLEGGTIPKLSATQQVVGFGGRKAEDLNHLPAYGRLRAVLGLPGEFSLTLAYVPPIYLAGVTPHFFAAAIGRPVAVAGPFRLGLTAFGQLGAATGAFTCPRAAVAAGADPTRNPLGCLARSSDTLSMRYAGAELAAAYRIASARGLEPHVSVAGMYLADQFAVGARYGDVLDHTRLLTSGVTVSGKAGLSYPLGSRIGLAAEVLYAPLLVKRPGDTSARNEPFVDIRGVVHVRIF